MGKCAEFFNFLQKWDMLISHMDNIAQIGLHFCNDLLYVPPVVTMLLCLVSSECIKLDKEITIG